MASRIIFFWYDSIHVQKPAEVFYHFQVKATLIIIVETVFLFLEIISKWLSDEMQMS